jgi:hypothetical protein
MTQYLVAIHHPDNYDASLEDEAMDRDIDTLNDEMVAAGIRVFVGGKVPLNIPVSMTPVEAGRIHIGILCLHAHTKDVPLDHVLKDFRQSVLAHNKFDLPIHKANGSLL